MQEDTYKCIGFLFGNFRTVDPEDYLDFRHKTWQRIELVSDLRFGVLPPGILLRSPTGQPYIVLNSKMCPLDETFKVLK